MEKTMSPADKAEQVASEQNAGVAKGLSANLAGLPKEPIPPEVFGLLVEQLTAAIDKLGGGQFTMGPMPDQGEPVEAYPEQFALGVSALKTVFDKVPEGEPYRFSFALLEDQAGVDELTAILSSAAKDKKLAKVLNAPAPEPAPEKKTAKADDMMKPDGGVS